jgi:hypothetical protein
MAWLLLLLLQESLFGWFTLHLINLAPAGRCPTRCWCCMQYVGLTSACCWCPLLRFRAIKGTLHSNATENTACNDMRCCRYWLRAALWCPHLSTFESSCDALLSSFICTRYIVKCGPLAGVMRCAVKLFCLRVAAHRT